MQKQTLLGIDTGGTFTDFVFLDPNLNTWRVHKVLSTPAAPQDAIIRGIHELGLTEAIRSGSVNIIHGTTVATNAALEGKGARTAYITNKGMKDVLRIGRQTRAELYNLTPSKSAIPVNEELLFELDVRVDHKGQTVVELTPEALEDLEKKIADKQPTAIAINFLFSFLNPDHEKRVAERFTGDYFVSRSSEVMPEYREYERGATTWVNSWLGPRIEAYLTDLKAQLDPAPLAIMQSSGLTIAAELAARKAVNLLLSGPAGGLAAAKYIAQSMHRDRLLTFDMGGTSTDVALIDGAITLTNEGGIAGIPIGIPMADIHTIGAGGGSIAYMDEGGLLNVGPESAGADPGPACYGQGGTKPTVTDANLLLGNLDPNTRLADNLSLDFTAAEKAIGELAEQLGQSTEQTAEGIIAIANEHMVQALRVISIQRGHDPREFSLVCFGGAGGLHVCDIADALEMSEIIVPINSGVLSAYGMLTTQPGRELSRTVQVLAKDISQQEVETILEQISTQGAEELKAEGVLNYTRKDQLELRYQGQTSTLTVTFESDLGDTLTQFEAAHEHQFGHRLARPIELLNCRVHLEANHGLPEIPAFETQPAASSVICRRESLEVNQTRQGPCLIIDDHATVRLPSHWAVQLDQSGNLILNKVA